MQRPLSRRNFLCRTAPGYVGLAIGGILVGCSHQSPVSYSTNGRTDFAAPFGITVNGTTRSLWKLSSGAQVAAPSVLHLVAGANALSPWVESAPEVVYTARITSTGKVRLSVEWDDQRYQPVSSYDSSWVTGDVSITLTTPPNAYGFRLRFVSGDEDAAVTAYSLTLARGVRIEPFPDYQRAAFAFSYDWESAMGGLIHTRSLSNSEGAGTQVTLRSDGGPTVAEAEAKGLHMRDGARFLAAQFARYGIRATFYATGYNLLSGNPGRKLFLGNPIYPNADVAHGWGSDYWKTHPWYQDDPYATETMAPAWYFASATRELADAGHEIASHSFGHLYVRGVTPEQLESDLTQWRQSARDLGVPVAPSFAFPWTSSNSLDERFWSVFVRGGWTILTRLYPLDLRHPYELDSIAADPRLTIFPDLYLPSKSAGLDDAQARIEETLVRRGYFSLWTHPNEVMEQDGQAVWTRVIDTVAAARERGLWVAPVAEIVGYTLAVRAIMVRSDSGARRISVENRSDRLLNGLTLTLPYRVGGVMIDGKPAAGGLDDQIRLPALPAGTGVVVQAMPA